MKTISQLHRAALSTRVGTVCAALSELARTRQFILSTQDIAQLQARASQEIEGWLFAYQAHQLQGPDLLAQLRAGASFANPRIREQVCDMVGDLGMVELLPELMQLQSDATLFVAEAARASLAMLQA